MPQGDSSDAEQKQGHVPAFFFSKRLRILGFHLLDGVLECFVTLGDEKDDTLCDLNAATLHDGEFVGSEFLEHILPCFAMRRAGRKLGCDADAETIEVTSLDGLDDGDNAVLSAGAAVTRRAPTADGKISIVMDDQKNYI